MLQRRLRAAREDLIKANTRHEQRLALCEWRFLEFRVLSDQLCAKKITFSENASGANIAENHWCESRILIASKLMYDLRSMVAEFVNDKKTLGIIQLKSEDVNDHLRLIPLHFRLIIHLHDRLKEIDNARRFRMCDLPTVNAWCNLSTAIIQSLRPLLVLHEDLVVPLPYTEQHGIRDTRFRQVQLIPGILFVNQDEGETKDVMVDIGGPEFNVYKSKHRQWAAKVFHAKFVEAFNDPDTVIFDSVEMYP